MTAVRAYEMRRKSGLTLGVPVFYCLRDPHVAARKALGWVVVQEGPSRSGSPSCDDCEAAGESSAVGQGELL